MDKNDSDIDELDDLLARGFPRPDYDKNQLFIDSGFCLFFFDRGALCALQETAETREQMEASLRMARTIRRHCVRELAGLTLFGSALGFLLLSLGFTDAFGGFIRPTFYPVLMVLCFLRPIGSYEISKLLYFQAECRLECPFAVHVLLHLLYGLILGAACFCRLINAVYYSARVACALARTLGSDTPP